MSDISLSSYSSAFDRKPRWMERRIGEEINLEEEEEKSVLNGKEKAEEAESAMGAPNQAKSSICKWIFNILPRPLPAGFLLNLLPCVLYGRNTKLLLLLATMLEFMLRREEGGGDGMSDDHEADSEEGGETISLRGGF